MTEYVVRYTETYYVEADTAADAEEAMALNLAENGPCLGKFEAKKV